MEIIFSQWERKIANLKINEMKVEKVWRFQCAAVGFIVSAIRCFARKYSERNCNLSMSKVKWNGDVVDGTHIADRTQIEGYSSSNTQRTVIASAHDRYIPNE